MSLLASALASFVPGLAVGVILQRSHFCTMGSISDAVLFGSFRRLRVWALALATALVGTWLLDALALVDLSASSYRQEGWLFAGALPGGILFGFGMVQAGGCVSRNLVRLGSGSLKALVTLLVLAIAATATAALLPSPVTSIAHQGTALLPVAASGGLLLLCLRHPGFRRSREDLATGLLLGAVIPLGWLATSLGAIRPDSVNYLALDRPGLVLPLAAGTVLGALATALWRGEFRLERFTATGDLRRHLVGGLLMGVGGVLAMGCTLGQGLTGASALSPGSLLALAGMLVGGWWGVKYLETGRLLPLRRRRQLAQVGE